MISKIVTALIFATALFVFIDFDKSDKYLLEVSTGKITTQQYNCYTKLVQCGISN